MKILHIDCSPRWASRSRALSASTVAQLRAYAPDLDMTYHDLASGPLPPVDVFYATALARRPPSGDGPFARNDATLRDANPRDRGV